MSQTATTVRITMSASQLPKLLLKAKEGMIQIIKPGTNKGESQVEVELFCTSTELYLLGESMGRPDNPQFQ